MTALVVGGGLGLASTLRRIDWATFASAIANVSAAPLALALGLSTVQVFAQLARFAVILPRAERSPLRQLLDVTAAGQLLNYAMPLRAGDAYKVARLSSGGPHPPGRAARLTSALVLERVADTLSLLLVTASTLGSPIGALRAFATPVRENAARAGFALAGVGVVVALLARRPPRVVAAFARDTWETISSPRFVRCFAVAVATWVLDAGTLCWTARSAGSRIALGSALQCVFLLNVGIAIPLTVGNLGVFEASLGFALSRYGMAAEHALAIATLEHLVKLAGLVLCAGILRLVPRVRRP